MNLVVVEGGLQIGEFRIVSLVEKKPHPEGKHTI